MLCRERGSTRDTSMPCVSTMGAPGARRMARFTNVPLLLPKSVTRTPPVVASTSACRDETLA